MRRTTLPLRRATNRATLMCVCVCVCVCVCDVHGVLQESYVWGMYTQRIWDFFPVGECFRKQYEEELTTK